MAGSGRTGEGPPAPASDCQTPDQRRADSERLARKRPVQWREPCVACPGSASRLTSCGHLLWPRLVLRHCGFSMAEPDKGLGAYMNRTCARHRPLLLLRSSSNLPVLPIFQRSSQSSRTTVAISWCALFHVSQVLDDPCDASTAPVLAARSVSEPTFAHAAGRAGPAEGL